MIPVSREVRHGRRGSTDFPARGGGRRRRSCVGRAVPGLRRPVGRRGPRRVRPRRAGADPGPARRRGPAVVAGGFPLPLLPRHRVPGRARRRHQRCPAGTTAWPPSAGATATCCWSATTRSTAPGRRSATPSQAYDPMAQGGTTTIEVTRTGEVLHSYTSLNGTQMNCSGGPMPWGSWVTCEETVNGPDVGPDFTGVSNVPLTAAARLRLRGPRARAVRPGADHRGRSLPHEAVAFDPRLAATSTSPRTTSASPPASTATARGATRCAPAGSATAAGCRCWRSRASRTSTWRRRSRTGRTYRVEWVDIDDPAPSFPYTPGETAPTTNDAGPQPRRQPGARAGRGVLLPAGGRGLRRRRRLLHLDPGRRAGGGEHRTDRRRLRQRPRADLGVPHPRQDPAAALPVARPGRARLPGQRHHQPAGHARRLRGQRRRQLPARA